MTCAACHTGEITYQNKRLRIEGGATLADFQGFMRELTRALAATREQPEKWPWSTADRHNHPEVVNLRSAVTIDFCKPQNLLAQYASKVIVDYLPTR